MDVEERPEVMPEAMTLVDIFDRLFKLVAKTVWPNLIIATLLLLPAAILFIIAGDVFFSAMAESLLGQSEIDLFMPVDLAGIVGGFVLFIIASILFTLSSFAATLGITIIGCSEMTGKRLSWQQALRQTLSIRLFRLFGQVILEYLALSGLVFILFTFLALGVSADFAIATLAGALVSTLVIVGAVYLFIKWAFAIVVIGWEDVGVFKSFGRSFSLVRGYWWKTFGIMVLLNLIAQFAITIISTPLAFVLQWGFLSKYYSSWIHLVEDEIDPDVYYEVFQSFGVGFGVSMWLSTIITLLIIPLIAVVMYFDLLARKRIVDQSDEISPVRE